MDRAAAAGVAPTIVFWFKSHGPWLFNFLLSFPGRVDSWVTKAVNGNVRFNARRGTLTVGVSGFYYIYSQLYYFDGSTYMLSHFTYINDRKVLVSASSVVSSHRKYNTNYHGGVFRLQSGDQVSVKVGVTKKFHMNPEYSFFGLFLVHD